MTNIMAPYQYLQASGKSCTKKGPGRNHKQGIGKYGTFLGGFTGAKLFRAIFNKSLTKQH